MSEPRNLIIRAISEVKMIKRNQKRSIDWTFVKGEPVGDVAVRLLLEVLRHGNGGEIKRVVSSINKIIKSMPPTIIQTESQEDKE